MSQDLKSVATAAPGAPARKQTFPQMLESFKGEIVRALPQHLNGERMARIALTAFRRTPKLAQCDPRSVFAAVIQASQLGLEPDTLGRSYLVPYGTECQFIPGWKGLMDLMNRSGQGSAWAKAVFAGDEFDYGLGDRPFVKHKPCGESNPNKMLYTYAVGWVKEADWPHVEVWSNARVMAHRDRYNKVGKKHYSYENWEMYARKVVLLQVLKYMPCSAELATAMALNDAADRGSQGMTVQDAIEGTWTPAVDEETPQQQAETNTKTEEKAEVKTEAAKVSTTMQVE